MADSLWDPAASSDNKEQGLHMNQLCFLTKNHIIVKKFSLAYKIRYSQTLSHNLIFCLGSIYPGYQYVHYFQVLCSDISYCVRATAQTKKA